MNSAHPATEYDVIVIGGALSGASTALLLLREIPGLRVLIIERSTVFKRRVGEATVEVSGYFLGRVLGLTRYLNEAHLVKQGMRFWFHNHETDSLDSCSEIGGRYLARVPAYQVDRALLDQEVLQRAVAAGATTWRPATVQEVALQAGGRQTLSVRLEGEERIVHCRWVVDASGLAATLSRAQGWWRTNPAHPTTAVWSRWSGVADWDGPELARQFPEWAALSHGIRATATNHFMGDGWWGWCIPLKGGDTSVGVVFDDRRVQWPAAGTMGERLRAFLMEHPVAREILRDARWTEGDVHWRKALPYSSSRYAGDGFALVGDAGAFIDPFYSPGLDWMSFTVTAAVKLIMAERKGEPVKPLVDRMNADFTRSYDRWFRAIYLDKYDYLGDFEIMRCAFLLDLGLYYMGVASQPFKRGGAALSEPVFSTKPSVPFYHMMSTYNRRLAAMARERRVRGTFGRHNARRRFLFSGYTFEPASGIHILSGLLKWAGLELREGWRTWFKRPASKPLTLVPEKLSQPAAHF